MAIQVNGTTVIDNSRSLTNISSIDATTAAAFTAGGVGGAGFSLTAGEAITAGDSVGLQSDGTVAKAVKPYLNTEHTVTDTFSGTSSMNNGRNHIIFDEYSGYCFTTGLSTSSGYGSIQFRAVKFNDDGTVTNSSNIVDIVTGAYNDYYHGVDITSDGAGNFGGVVRYTDYSSGSGRVAFFTFTMSGGTIQNFDQSVYTGSFSYTNCNVTTYGENKFIATFTGASDNINYACFYRSGSSCIASKTPTPLGTASSSHPCKSLSLHGHLNPTVANNEAVFVVCANGQHPTFGVGVYSNSYCTFAAVTLTIDGTNTATLNTVTQPFSNQWSSAVFSYVEDYYADPINLMPMTNEGIFVTGTFTSYFAKIAFKKASASSTNITYLSHVESKNWGSGTAVYVDKASGTMYHSKSISVDVYRLEDLNLANLIASIPLSGDYIFRFYSWWGGGNGTAIVGNYVFNKTYLGKVYSGQFGNVASFLGVAENTVASGGSVDITPLGGVNNSYTGLSIGSVYGIGSTAGSIAAGVTPRLGVSISATEIAVDNSSV